MKTGKNLKIASVDEIRRALAKEDVNEVRHYPLDECIRFSSRIKEEKVLSNMYPCILQVEERGEVLTFNSAEHMFQYFLFASCPEVQWAIYRCPNAFLAKRVAMRNLRKLAQMPDVELLLRRCHTVKYLQCEAFRNRLIASASTPLVEYAEWGDVHFGVCELDGELIGCNICGRSMMYVRDRMSNGRLAA